MKTISVRFSPTQIARLEKIANLKNGNISDILRELVNSNFEEIDKNQSLEEQTEKLKNHFNENFQKVIGVLNQQTAVIKTKLEGAQK